jgi:hypothetical protein
MPAYRIRYVCETALQSENDVTFESGGRRVAFLFSQKKGEGNTIHVCVDVEAPG